MVSLFLRDMSQSQLHHKKRKLHGNKDQQSFGAIPEHLVSQHHPSMLDCISLLLAAKKNINKGYLVYLATATKAPAPSSVADSQAEHENHDQQENLLHQEDLINVGDKKKKQKLKPSISIEVEDEGDSKAPNGRL